MSGLNELKHLFKARTKCIWIKTHEEVLAIEQIKASEQYMKWYMKHVAVLDTKPGDFFEHACYGGYKQRYITREAFH